MIPITQSFAEKFADEWTQAWNAHDLEAILAHYADTFEMSSPFICQIMGDASGKLVGKSQVREYWARALAKMPELRFELKAVFCGANSVALHYVNQVGRSSVEVFFFDAYGHVERAAAHYLSDL